MSVLLKGRLSSKKLQDEGTIQKARTVKYIRRWPDPKNPKKWRYLYPADFLKPLLALKTFFQLKEDKVTKAYEENNIQNDYEADKKTFAAHVLDYLSNKIKWDNFFSKKKNRENYRKPQKMKAKAGNNRAKSKEDTGPASPKNKKPKIDKPANIGYDLNISLMRKVWGIFNKQEERADERSGQNNAGIRSRTLSEPSGQVQPGQAQGNGGEYGHEAIQGTPDNESDVAQLPSEHGERPGRGIRLTKTETKNIREACQNLLNSKTDNEMTEEDKDLLRQYEGAGGLAEDGASTHGTLYEYYTPRNVVKKVWQLVDKYIPGAKNVLEPSAGIGRFAEDRPVDKLTLNEYDPTSSRISRILNPQAENTQGAFQAMFKPGKEYTGRKYDVVIGNPPYGTYEGLWKGKGEGADHKRYDEYFIDRGLDTLREGGIMAFVVPSSFLRNGDSKIKHKIAGKGKLLEAWRLPNGTFNTTGVGTDIIILRKEKGDPAQFSNNAYFEKNSSMVMGVETTRTGRFGEEKYVGLTAGETFDEAIDRINAGEVEAAPLGVPTTKEKAIGDISVKAKPGRKKSTPISPIDKKVILQEYELRLAALQPDLEAAIEAHDKGITGPLSEAIIKEAENLQQEINKIEQKTGTGKSRAEAMKGNDNAAGKHNMDTAAEFNARYNKHIDPEALPIWKATEWDGSINIYDLQNTHYLENSGNYVKAANGKWYNIVNFASGNIYEKLAQLERDQDLLSKTEYVRQKKILENALPKPKTVVDFEVSPLSSLAEKFITSETRNQRTYRPGSVDVNPEPMNLNEAFIEWVTKVPRNDLAIRPGLSCFDIRDYVNKQRVLTQRSRSDEDKEANRAEAQRKITDRREAAERLFNQFIRERLSLDDQKRLADTYNRQYNGIVQADYSKIPVFLDGISKTFKGDEFRANDSQMKGVSWLANQGNGIVAFDVGVGKTVTAIMAAMNDIQMGRCVRPFIPVPKSVYKNWAFEINQLFPGVKVNMLGNFSEIAKYKGPDGKLNIEAGSISLCTYEALEKIGFTDETLEGDLKEAFIEAISSTE